MRKFLQKMLNHWLFERVTIYIIVFSIIALIFENPLLDPNSWQSKALKIISYCSVTFFCLEVVLKTIVLGFLFNGYFSYFRNYWNILDFIIVLF